MVEDRLQHIHFFLRMHLQLKKVAVRQLRQWHLGVRVVAVHLRQWGVLAAALPARQANKHLHPRHLCRFN